MILEKVFYGSNNVTYKSVENETALKTWMASFPTEVEAYTSAIADYLKADYETLSDANKATYNDLNSQFIMFSRL